MLLQVLVRDCLVITWRNQCLRAWSGRSGPPFAGEWLIHLYRVLNCWIEKNQGGAFGFVDRGSNSQLPNEWKAAVSRAQSHLCILFLLFTLKTGQVTLWRSGSMRNRSASPHPALAATTKGCLWSNGHLGWVRGTFSSSDIMLSSCFVRRGCWKMWSVRVRCGLAGPCVNKKLHFQTLFKLVENQLGRDPERSFGQL